MRRAIGIGTLAVFIAIGMTPTIAVGQESQEDSEEINPHARSGFFFNGGLGYGSLGCESCIEREGGLSGTLSFGGTLSQKLLLSGSTYGWTKEVDGTRLTMSALTATLRFYPSATGGFYLLGGIGYGNADVSISGLGSTSEGGAAAVLGLGIDLRIGDNVSLTPYLNGIGLSINESTFDFGQIGLSITTH